MDLFSGKADPARQRFLLRKGLKDCFIGPVDVFRVAREGRPAKRAATLTEERANVLGDEAGDLKRLRNARCYGLGA